MDKISNLPNEIIGHIGSFLSAKEAAFAMVLSKRWKNVFTIIPELQFHSSVNNTESFTDFVDGLLALPVTSRIRKFSLKLWFKDIEPARYDDINRSLCHVLKLGVVDLELRVYGGGGYSLPLEVFTCKTVAKLKLGYGFTIDFLPANAYLPSLKTLFLDSVLFKEYGRCCVFDTLLSACPVLEELLIDGVEFERWKWSFTVSSPTLQRLTIRRDAWEPESDDDVLDCRGLAYEFDSLSFDTPGLTYLEYFDYVPKEYLFLNLNSLVEAKLDLRADYDIVWDERHADIFDPMNLINGLKHVEILDLSLETMLMIYVFRKAIPVFQNLVRLSVDNGDACWYSLKSIVKKSPNLKTLIIKNPLHSDDSSEEEGYVCRCVSKYSFLLSCPLEVLKITKYYGSIEELEQMKRILEKLSCLKLVEVHAQVTGDEKLQVMEDLLLLPRASSKCKIQVKFS